MRQAWRWARQRSDQEATALLASHAAALAPGHRSSRAAAPASSWEDPAATIWGAAMSRARAVDQTLLLNAPHAFCGEEVPAPLRGAFFEGVGAGIRCRTVGSLPATLLRRVCSTQQATFQRGWNAARHCR